MKKASHLVYTRFCFRPAPKNITLLRTSFLRFSNISQSEIPVQEHLKRRKQRKPPKKSDGHEIHADTKCTAHGLAIMSFSAGAGSQIAFYGVALPTAIHRSMKLDSSLFLDCVLGTQISHNQSMEKVQQAAEVL